MSLSVRRIAVPIRAGVVEVRVSRELDSDTSLALRAIATHAFPSGTVIGPLSQITMRRHVNGDAGIINGPIATIARPLSAGMVEIGIVRHMYGYAGLSNRPITALAFPSSSIGGACRVSIVRHFDGVAGALVRPIALLTFPAFSIAGRACIIRYIHSGALGEQRRRETGQKKRERHPRHGKGRWLSLSRHVALMPLDSSSQTTKVTVSAEDRNINTCLVDLNARSVKRLPRFGRELTFRQVWMTCEAAPLFSIRKGSNPSSALTDLDFYRKQIERGKSFLRIAHSEWYKMDILLND